MVAAARRGEPGGCARAHARRFAVAALRAALAVAATSCAPAGPSPMPAPTRAPLIGAGEAGLPRVVARPTEAVARYAELCARCHGPDGAGDGYLAPTLDPPPTSFRDPARRHAPARAHRAIARGVVGSSMKRFDHVLDEAALWDMAFLAWSMAEPPDALARGAALFADRCASCHGLPSAPGPHRLDDPALAARAPDEAWARLRARHGDVLPADAGDVDALVAAVYAFLYEPIGRPTAPPTASAPPGDAVTSRRETH